MVKGPQQNWLAFRDSIVQVQEWSILRKTRRHIWRPAWQSKKVMAQLQHEKAVYRRAQGLDTQEESRNTAQACRDNVMEGKIQLELRFTRNVKGSKNF